jgi:hypothetical protein
LPILGKPPAPAGALSNRKCWHREAERGKYGLPHQGAFLTDVGAPGWRSCIQLDNHGLLPLDVGEEYRATTGEIVLLLDILDKVLLHHCSIDLLDNKIARDRNDTMSTGT